MDSPPDSPPDSPHPTTDAAQLDEHAARIATLYNLARAWLQARDLEGRRKRDRAAAHHAHARARAWRYALERTLHDRLCQHGGRALDLDGLVIYPGQGKVSRLPLVRPKPAE